MTTKLLNIAIYSYRGAKRLRPLLWTIRNLGGDNIDVVVAQDYDGSVPERDAYAGVCDEYDTGHLPLEEHAHMSGACHAAVEATGAPWVLVCSDDVLLPAGFLRALVRFLETNAASRRLMSRIAGAYIHHWDRADIDDMGRPGLSTTTFVPELSGFRSERDFYVDFYAMEPEPVGWWWKRLGYRLPQPQWSEPTPPNQLACCSNVHGAVFLVNRDYWDLVGGCAGVDSWQNDSVYSLRVGQWTDGIIVRLPGLPAVAHYGAGAPTPPDPTGRWRQTIWNLVREHGGEYDAELRDIAGGDKPQDCLTIIERGLKLRAYSMQQRYADEIAGLDMSYMMWRE